MHKRALWLLYVSQFLVMVGFSVLFPVEPAYIQQFHATAFTLGLLLAVFAGVQIPFSAIWGPLSDRIGRRPVLLIGLMGFALSMALFGMANQLWLLFVSRALAGAFSAATMPTAKAYVADVTEPQERTRYLGMLGAAMGLGFVFGPAIGGVVGKTDLRYPFFLSAALAVLVWLLVLAWVGESLPPAQRGRVQRQRTVFWDAFRQGDLSYLYGLGLLANISLAGLEASFGFFAATVLGANPETMGLMFLGMGLVSAFVQGFIHILNKRVGEGRLMEWGLGVSALGFVAIAFSRSVAAGTWALCLYGAGSALIRPANTGLVSKNARGGQGEALGWLDAMSALGRTFGPIFAGWLFKMGPSLPFYSGAIINLVGLVALVALFGTLHLKTGRAE